MAQRPEGTVAFEAVLFTLTTPANTALENKLSIYLNGKTMMNWKPEAYDESSGKEKGC